MTLQELNIANMTTHNLQWQVVAQEAFYVDDAEIPTYIESPQERRDAELQDLLHPGTRDKGGQIGEDLVSQNDFLPKSPLKTVVCEMLSNQEVNFKNLSQTVSFS